MKNSLASLILTLAFALTATTARADAFRDGTTAYAAGDYQGAVRDFELALTASGQPSAALYYDLALAQLHVKDLPATALSLHRALLLDPQMNDAKVALSELERSEGVAPAPQDWRLTVADKIPPAALLVPGVAAFWIGLIGLTLATIRGSAGFWPRFLAVLLLLAGAASAVTGGMTDLRWMNRDGGIVMDLKGAKLLANPADQSPVVLALPATSPVHIIRRSGEWTYCQAPTGEMGWVPSAAVTAIVPAT